MNGGHSDNEISRFVAFFRMERFLNGELIRNLGIRRYQPFQTVLSQDDTTEYLHFLVEGQVQCIHYHMNGKIAVLALSEPFTAIGDLEILSDRPIRSNVITVRPTTFLTLRRRVVEKHGAADALFLRFLLEQVREKLISSNEVQLAHVLPVQSRLALFLLGQIEGNAYREIRLPDKETLASLLATTTRHLNRVFRPLLEGGILGGEYPRIGIRDRDALERVVE